MDSKVKAGKLIYRGREFDVMSCASPYDANAFMLKNPDYGVLCYREGKEVYMARMGDMGKEVVKH